MIKVKVSDLLNSMEILQKLSNTDLKARLAWQVTRLLKSVDKEIQDFNETRMALINKYGEKDENGRLVSDENDNCKIVQEHIKDFGSELNELVNAEVEINANKIKIEDIENLNFTPSEMSNLEVFIDFGEEPEVTE